ILLTNNERIVSSSLLVLLLATCSYFLYSRLGAGQDLPRYYSEANILQRQNYTLMRPLYARLQRELIRDQLDLKLDLESIDLILNFAQLHSQAQNGILQAEIQQILRAVLKAMPQQ